MKTKCAGYIRVSTVDQATHGLSLSAQKDLLERYAAEHDMELVEIYADEGKSASKSLEKRTELLRLIADAEAGKFSVFIFKDITRYSRNAAAYYKVQERLDKCGVGWIAVEQPYLETVTPTGKFQVSIMLGTAQLEADQTGQRIRFTQDAEVAKGYFPFPAHCAPLGYTTEKRDGHNRLVPDPRTRGRVEEIFREFLLTGNATRAGRVLHMEHQNVLRTLKNRVYIGEFRGIPNFCEPIITEETFNQAQALMRHHAYTPPKHDYIFTGITYCGLCGSKMRWNCPNDKYPMCSCRNCKNTLTEREMERQVIETLEPVLNEYKVNLKKRPMNKEKALKKRFEQKLKRLNELYIDGVIDRAEFDKRREEYQRSIAEIDIPAMPSIPLNWKRAYMMLDKAQKNVTWKILIDHLTVKDKEVHIYFEPAKVLAERMAMSFEEAH